MWPPVSPSRPSTAVGRAAAPKMSGGVKGWTLNGHIVRGLDDDPKNLLYRAIFLDTAQLAKIVMEMPEVDPTRVGATGGSQGGGLTLACVSLEPRIKKAAPVFPFLCDYQRVWEIDQDVDAYDELRAWFRRFDPRHERESQMSSPNSVTSTTNTWPLASTPKCSWLLA